MDYTLHIMKQAEQEITELHIFFQDWLGGSLSKTPQVFERFVANRSEDFKIINPNGLMQDKDMLTTRLYNAHGSRPGMVIYTEMLQCHALSPDVILAVYVEHQEIGGAKSNRVSSALFSKDSSCPNGLKWHHVHETWRP